jgi:hypothetical protein
VLSVAFSHDKQLLAAGAMDGTVAGGCVGQASLAVATAASSACRGQIAALHSWRPARFWFSVLLLCSCYAPYSGCQQWTQRECMSAAPGAAPYLVPTPLFSCGLWRPRLAVWDMSAGGRLLHMSGMKGHHKPIRSLAFTPGRASHRKIKGITQGLHCRAGVRVGRCDDSALSGKVQDWQ